MLLSGLCRYTSIRKIESCSVYALIEFMSGSLFKRVNLLHIEPEGDLMTGSKMLFFPQGYSNELRFISLSFHRLIFIFFSHFCSIMVV